MTEFALFGRMAAEATILRPPLAETGRLWRKCQWHSKRMQITRTKVLLLLTY